MMHRLLPLFALFLLGSLSCQTIDESEEGQRFNEGLWGEAGGVAFERSAKQMINNYPEYAELESADKEALRIVFGDLVDSIHVHWNAEPLNEWASEQYGIAVVGAEAEAQAYGFDIYMRGLRISWSDPDRLATLIHELTHSEQFQRYGGSLKSFGDIYFRYYYRAGKIYEDNEFEVEARQRAQAWEKRVLDEFRRLTGQAQNIP